MLAEDIKNRIQRSTHETPSIFIPFGSPMQAIDFDEFSESIAEYLSTLPDPRNIVIVSPFWTTVDKVEVTSCKFPDLIYDFDTGPETLKLLTYPCSGNPDLAETIVHLLESRDITATMNEDRGLDKGAWVPMYFIYPEMEYPVIQLSLPINASRKELFKIGETLRDLRKMGTLLIFVGNTVHHPDSFTEDDKYSPADQWAVNLDGEIMQRIIDFDLDTLIKMDLQSNDRQNKGEETRFLPLLMMMGTMQQKDHIDVIFDRFFYHNTSMRSFAFISNY